MKVYTGISYNAAWDLYKLRIEMKKTNPDTDTIFCLISGYKYNKPIKK